MAMRFPSLVPCALFVVAVAPAFTGPAAADVTWETTVRIMDALGRGTAQIDETVRTAVSATARREEVAGSRRMTTRRGRHYERPGHRATLERLDEATAYELDLDAGTYTKRSFAELKRERERTLAEAESAFRGVSPDAAPDRPVSLTRSGERLAVDGIPCSPARLDVTRETGQPTAERGADAAAAGRTRFAMSLELCLTDESEWTTEVRATEERVRELTGDTDAYLGRLLDVLARRRDLFAIFDDLHSRLERERRKLGGLAIRWVEQMTGPQRGNAGAVLFRLEGTVTALHVGPVGVSEFSVPPTLELAERRRER